MSEEHLTLCPPSPPKITEFLLYQCATALLKFEKCFFVDRVDIVDLVDIVVWKHDQLNLRINRMPQIDQPIREPSKNKISICFASSKGSELACRVTEACSLHRKS